MLKVSCKTREATCIYSNTSNTDIITWGTTISNRTSISFWLFTSYSSPKSGQTRFSGSGYLNWQFLAPSTDVVAQRLPRKLYFLTLSRRPGYWPSPQRHPSSLFTLPHGHLHMSWPTEAGFHSLLTCFGRRQFILPHSPREFHRDESGWGTPSSTSPSTHCTPTAFNSSQPQPLFKWLWGLFSILWS